MSRTSAMPVNGKSRNSAIKYQRPAKLFECAVPTILTGCGERRPRKRKGSGHDRARTLVVRSKFFGSNTPTPLFAANRHGVVSTLVLLAAWLPAALTAQSQLTLRVLTETAQAGGWAQIKVFCDTPTLISRGVLEMDLDPTFFGPVAGISAYSPTGDVMGYGSVNGTRVVVSIVSPSGGLGQLPGVPIFTVQVPVLAQAARTGFVALSLPDRNPFLVGNPSPVPNVYPQYAWTDQLGNPYSVSMISGTIFTNVTNGSVTVRSITPGGGLQSVGTVLQINGTGFDNTTQITADGVAFSAVQYVSPTQMTVTLASAVEIGGVPFHVQTGNMQPANFFPALQSDIGNNAHVILPLTTQIATVAAGSIRPEQLILQNPTANPVDVRLLQKDFASVPSSTLITISAGATQTVQVDSSATAQALAGQPLRMGLLMILQGTPRLTQAFVLDPAASGPPSLGVSTSNTPISADYQAGTAPPASVMQIVNYPSGVQNVNLATSGEAWFKVTEVKSPKSDTFTVSFDPTGLAAGTYQGSIKITPVISPSLTGFLAATSIVTVTLKVSAQPTISVQGIYSSGVNSTLQALSITTNGGPAPFTISVSTQSGGNWLSTDVQSGTAPATVQVRENPAGLAGGYYLGRVTVQGPINSVAEDFAYRVDPLPLPAFTENPPSLSFLREAGDSVTPSVGFISFENATAGFSAKVESSDGAPWLSIMAVIDVPSRPSVTYNVDSRGLAAGIYTATIVGTSGGATARAMITLTVLPKPVHPLVLSVSRLSFTAPAGVMSAGQQVSITSLDGPVVFNFATRLGAPIQLVKNDPAANLPSGMFSGFVAPTTFTLATTFSAPGSWEDTLTFTTSAGTVQIPLSVYITAAPSSPPVIVSLVNAASELRGPIAPGEIITIRGLGVGPPTVGVQLDSQGRVLATANPNAQVLINGVTAPIVYGSIGQWNVVVPYEVDGAKSAAIQVSVGGVASNVWTVPVAPSAPAFFTASGTGVGAAAVLNQDGTINSSTNPAPRGTVVSLFLTGGGQTLPAGVTGSVTGASGARPLLPVSIQVVDRNLTLQYAGEAPGLVSGVMQVNAILPSDLPFGALRTQVQIGDAISPMGITIAVQ